MDGNIGAHVDLIEKDIPSSLTFAREIVLLIVLSMERHWIVVRPIDTEGRPKKAIIAKLCARMPQQQS